MGSNLTAALLITALISHQAAFCRQIPTSKTNAEDGNAKAHFSVNPGANPANATPRQKASTITHDPNGEKVALIAPAEYLVGEADVLRINVWKEQELSQMLVVRPDGKISLPLIGELKVSGMTPAQIESNLLEKLKSIIVDPQVTVTVAEIHSKMVYITGEVGKAGEYPLLSPSTVLQLIARAGGLSQFADRKGIFVLRDVDGKRMRYKFEYQEVIRGKKAEQNIELRPGDTVVVP